MRLEKFHKDCFACGRHSPSGLKLKFRLLRNGTLRGEFRINKKYQGYDDSSHGGIIATILVSSMINLFYHKCRLKLKTARLNIRYKRPIPVEEKIKVRAIEQDKLRSFYRAKSQILFGDIVFAEAEGYFKK